MSACVAMPTKVKPVENSDMTGTGKAVELAVDTHAMTSAISSLKHNAISDPNVLVTRFKKAPFWRREGPLEASTPSSPGRLDEELLPFALH